MTLPEFKIDKNNNYCQKIIVTVLFYFQVRQLLPFLYET